MEDQLRGLALMSRKNAYLGNLAVEIRKRAERAKVPAENGPLLLPNDPSENFLTAEDWVNLAAATRLTVRELEVANLLFAGKTRAGVARRLRLDIETVRVYIDRLFKKLGVRNLRGMILRIARLHLASRFNSTDPLS
jgi:DNA-binding NarL/FixJ family response regulator